MNEFRNAFLKDLWIYGSTDESLDRIRFQKKFPRNICRPGSDVWPMDDP